MNKIFIFLTLILSSCATTHEKKEMVVSSFSPVKSFDDSASVFSGKVKVQLLFNSHPDDSLLTGGKVTFSPKSRSAWHTHPNGQLLVVTEGQGIVQQWGEKAKKMKAGEVVWTPAGVKHWHGGGEKTSVVHFALQETDGKTNVNWMEKVSNEQYQEAVQSLR